MSNIPTEGKAVAQFGATWCSPCKQIKPHVQELARMFRAQFVYLDLEENANEAQKLNIRAMPTIVAFRDGQELGRVAGANLKAIESLVRSL